MVGSLYKNYLIEFLPQFTGLTWTVCFCINFIYDLKRTKTFLAHHI